MAFDRLVFGKSMYDQSLTPGGNSVHVSIVSTGHDCRKTFKSDNKKSIQHSAKLKTHHVLFGDCPSDVVKCYLRASGMMSDTNDV